MAAYQCMTQTITQAVTEAANAAIMAARKAEKPQWKQEKSAASSENRWASTEAANLQLEGTRQIK